MSFIDKFLDLTAPLPRAIVRFLKLYRVAEERSKDINTKLKTNRENYLQKLKEKENNNDLISLKNTIDNLYKENLTLSDYKQEILKELQYDFEYSFLHKIEPIIEEGKKECQEQLMSTNLNGTFGTSSFNKIVNDDLKSISDLNDKKKKNEGKFIGIKKIRPKSRKKALGSEYIDEVSMPEGENEVYCKCKKPSFGNMIECDKCGEWFHYGCVKIDENNVPKEWNCEDCEKKLKKQEKPKKKKKNHN